MQRETLPCRAPPEAPLTLQAPQKELAFTFSTNQGSRFASKHHVVALGEFIEAVLVRCLTDAATPACPWESFRCGSGLFGVGFGSPAVPGEGLTMGSAQ